jgi:hypothetical protein
MEMVGFVLNDPGLPAGVLCLHRGPVRRGVGQLNEVRPRNHRLQAIQRQAALVKCCPACAYGYVGRVEQYQEVQGCPLAQAGDVRLDVEPIFRHGNLQRDPQLRGSQPDAGSVMHHAAHEIYQCGQFLIGELSVIAGGGLPQGRMPRLDDRGKSVCCQDGLNGLLDLGGTGRCGD